MLVCEWFSTSAVCGICLKRKRLFCSVLTTSRRTEAWPPSMPKSVAPRTALFPRPIRITSQVKWCYYSSTLFKRNRQLNIFDINNFQIVCFMYKFYSNLLPVNFNMLFQTNEQMHHHDTRSKSNIHVISHTTTMRSFSIRVQGPPLWNSLDPLITKCKILNYFKRPLKDIYYICIKLTKWQYYSDYILCKLFGIHIF